MKETQQNSNRVELAMALAKGKVVTPCVKVNFKNGIQAVEALCPLLDIKNGCQKEGGFIAKTGISVKCPEGKGTITIHGNENLIDIMQGDVLELIQE